MKMGIKDEIRSQLTAGILSGLLLTQSCVNKTGTDLSTENTKKDTIETLRAPRPTFELIDAEKPVSHYTTYTYPELKKKFPELMCMSEYSTVQGFLGSLNAAEVIKRYNPHLLDTTKDRGISKILQTPLSHIDSIIIPHVMPSVEQYTPRRLEDVEKLAPGINKLLNGDSTAIIVTQLPNGLFVNAYYIDGILQFADQVGVARGDNKINTQKYPTYSQKYKKINTHEKRTFARRKKYRITTDLAKHKLPFYTVFDKDRGAAMHSYPETRRSDGKKTIKIPIVPRDSSIAITIEIPYYNSRLSGTCNRQNPAHGANMRDYISTRQEFEEKLARGDKKIQAPTQIIFCRPQTSLEAEAALRQVEKRGGSGYNNDSLGITGKFHSFNSDEYKNYYLTYLQNHKKFIESQKKDSTLGVPLLTQKNTTSY